MFELSETVMGNFFFPLHFHKMAVFQDGGVRKFMIFLLEKYQL